MKHMTLTNFLLLTSATLLTACSSKDATPKTQAQLFQEQQAQIAQLPMATTYPMEGARITHSSYTASPAYEMQQIQVIDVPQQRYQHLHAPSQVQSRLNFQSQTRHYSNYQNNITRQIENESKNLLGKKYVWGATGPYNYDCSGFTQKIYRDAGINIPRVSRDQARIGQYVNYNNLKKGDMVFFDTKKKRTGLVSHVGIYLGDGNFIHASSSAKKVVIFNFNEKKFYKKRFLWGRRVIQNNIHMASL